MVMGVGFELGWGIDSEKYYDLTKLCGRAGA